MAIHSDNDYYVALHQADILKERLNAEVVIKKGMGHFSGDEGTNELPAALDAILTISL